MAEGACEGRPVAVFKLPVVLMPRAPDAQGGVHDARGVAAEGAGAQGRVAFPNSSTSVK